VKSKDNPHVLVPRRRAGIQTTSSSNQAKLDPVSAKVLGESS